MLPGRGDMVSDRVPRRAFAGSLIADDADFQGGRAHRAFAIGYAETEDDYGDEALRVVAAIDPRTTRGLAASPQRVVGERVVVGRTSSRSRCPTMVRDS